LRPAAGQGAGCCRQLVVTSERGTFEPKKIDTLLILLTSLAWFSYADFKIRKRIQAGWH
jgi:hypothetical protein